MSTLEARRQSRLRSIPAAQPQPQLPPEVVTAVAVTLRVNGNPTPFRFSSDARHALRADLCLKGWPWTTAEILAGEAVNAALRRIGARWPRWEEGQPEWTQAGVLNAPRTRCANCHRPLVEDQYRYCSELCASAWGRRMAEHDARDWARAERARDWRAMAIARLPERACKRCGSRFRPEVMTMTKCDECRSG